MSAVQGFIESIGTFATSTFNSVSQNPQVRTTAQKVASLVDSNYQFLFLFAAATQFVAAWGNFVVGAGVGMFFYKPILAININLRIPALFVDRAAKCAILIGILAMRTIIDVPALVTGFLFGCYVYRMMSRPAAAGAAGGGGGGAPAVAVAS